MGMPQFPERKNRPQVCDVVLELLESVAVEELALAHILNAEGEKLQELVKKYAYFDICSSQLEKICKSTQTMINSIIIKEWVLLNKVHAALDIYETMTDDDCKESGCDCRRCDCRDPKSRCEQREQCEHKIERA